MDMYSVDPEIAVELLDHERICSHATTRSGEFDPIHFSLLVLGG